MCYSSSLFYEANPEALNQQFPPASNVNQRKERIPKLTSIQCHSKYNFSDLDISLSYWKYMDYQPL
jgi:hypothetical protein